jgi:hypothetical protein
MNRRTNRIAWALAALLAVVLLAGAGALSIWLWEYPNRAVVINWGAVSPEGRWVLTQLSQPQDDNRYDRPHVIIEWKTGKTQAWRRVPFGNVAVWNPRGDLLVRLEIHSDSNQPEAMPLVCRRVPDLSEVWRVVPYRGNAAWSPDGEHLVARVGARRARAWDLVSISRLGVRRMIARDCTWIPWRVTMVGNDPAIVCSSWDDKPTQLALLRMDGSVIRRFGPKFQRGSYVIGQRLDRFGWQKTVSSEECFLAIQKGETWKRIRLSVPPIPKDYLTYLMPSGDDHLMLMQTYPDGFPVWAVDWAGKLRKLQRPGTGRMRPLPWIDGRHLLLDVEHRLELIDGSTGQIVRTVPVRLPGLKF